MLSPSMFTLTIRDTQLVHPGPWRIKGLLPSGSLLNIFVAPDDPADNTLQRKLPPGTLWIDSDGDPVEPRVYREILRDGYGLRLPCGAVGRLTVTNPPAAIGPPGPVAPVPRYPSPPWCDNVIGIGQQIGQVIDMGVVSRKKGPQPELATDDTSPIGICSSFGRLLLHNPTAPMAGPSSESEDSTGRTRNVYTHHSNVIFSTQGQKVIVTISARGLEKDSTLQMNTRGDRIVLAKTNEGGHLISELDHLMVKLCVQVASSTEPFILPTAEPVKCGKNIKASVSDDLMITLEIDSSIQDGSSNSRGLKRTASDWTVATTKYRAKAQESGRRASHKCRSTTENMFNKLLPNSNLSLFLHAFREHPQSEAPIALLPE